jgi:hypothetical protein
MKAIWVNPKEKFEKEVVIGDSTFLVQGWYTRPTKTEVHSLDIDVIALIVKGNQYFNLTDVINDLDKQLVSIRNLFAAKILKEYEN